MPVGFGGNHDICRSNGNTKRLTFPLRIVPPYFLLFEKLINVIHQHTPGSTNVCLNEPVRHGPMLCCVGFEASQK